MIYNNKGFTILELLVVIAVVAITSAFMVVNFRQGERANKLQLTAQKIVQNIRKAQNMALSSLEHQGEIYNYGVHLDKVNIPNSYYIFVDINDSRTYDSGVDNIKHELTLEGIEVDEIFILTTGGETEVSRVDVVFIPPDPLTEFNNDSDISEAAIVIKGEKTKWENKTIRVGKMGWISVE